MQAVDTIINARWVIPVEPDAVAYEHYSVAIAHGNIVDVLSSTQAAQRYTASETVHLADHALIPGLVNAHTHAAMSLLRGLADDLPLREWLTDHVWPAEQRWVGPEFVRDGCQLAIAEMIQGGTTCFNDMYFFPEDTARVCLDVGMRAVVGLILIDFPTAYAQTADEYLAKGLALHEKLRPTSVVTAAFAPHAPYTVSDAPLIKVRTLNNELNLPLHIHVHETAHEVADAVAKFGTRPLARLAELDLVNLNLTAVHMTQLLPEEIELLARAGASVVHCPQSNLKLASGFCPVAALTKAGVNVAIATDGAASNNDLDMFDEMRTTALLAKGVAGDATAVPAHTALRMATLNGARALGLHERTGSLTPGKAADITAIDLSAAASQPVYDPISQLVYTAGRDQVTDVWVNGRRLLRARELTTLDIADVLKRAGHWRDRIGAPATG